MLFNKGGGDFLVLLCVVRFHNTVCFTQLWLWFGSLPCVCPHWTFYSTFTSFSFPTLFLRGCDYSTDITTAIHLSLSERCRLPEFTLYVFIDTPTFLPPSSFMGSYVPLSSYILFFELYLASFLLLSTLLSLSSL